MKTAIFTLYLILIPLSTLVSQNLEYLAKEMVFGNDTSISTRSYKYFLSVIRDRTLETGDIKKNNGVAIAPDRAADCMLDSKRTQVFTKALYSAAKSLGKKDLKILYVGCGPLAPFMALTAPLLPNARYSLVEISNNSAETAKILIKRLGLQSQLDTMIIADATDMKVPDGKAFDIIITETMDAGLNNEMMIPILINILPQLKKEVILIPEEVTLELKVLKKSEPEEILEQYTIFSATELLGSYWNNGHFPEKSIAPTTTTPARIYVSTSIRVFGNLCLDEEESAITRKLPLKFIPQSPLHISYSIAPPELKFNRG